MTSLLLADVTPSAQAQEAMTKIFGAPEGEPFLQMLGNMTIESQLAVLDRTTLQGLEMARTVLHRSTSTFTRMQLLFEAAGVDFPAAGISDLIGANELRVAVAALAMAAELNNDPEYESRLKVNQDALDEAESN